MASVHRIYDIKDDAYYVRAEGSVDIYKFTGPDAEKVSYVKLKQLHAIEVKGDKSSLFLDHATHP